MTRTEMTEAITGNIATMWENNVDCQYAEQFEGWCEDGDVFDDGNLPVTDRAQLEELMKLVSPHVDAISQILYTFIEDGQWSGPVKDKRIK